MTGSDKPEQWGALDRDLNRISRVELAAAFVARPLVAPSIALIFIVMAALTAVLSFGLLPGSFIVVTAAAFGAYMAINIGANDVANNMGPAVGARALTMGGAIVIAAIAESAGALLAGGDVVSTVSVGIVGPDAVGDGQAFVWAMMAALIASALWVNLATWTGAPVSTTHSVVGGVVGAGIAAQGMSAVDWTTMGWIASGWIVAPTFGGLVAAGFLALIRSRIQSRSDKIAAARRWVPILVAIMAGAFAAYLAIKGLNNIVTVGPWVSAFIGLTTGIVAWAVTVPWVRHKSAGMENRTKSLKTLFGLPLILSAILLSFGHGANDVANAIGPVAAIVQVTEFGRYTPETGVSSWIMLIGAFGISFGLFLFGPKLIRLVGSEITKLNPMRAFCVALSTASTVIVASWIGLPVSSTHVAVGSVFGVGFYREWKAGQNGPSSQRAAPSARRMAQEERRRRKLVRRSHFLTIVAAWMITVPATAFLAAVVFQLLNLIG